MVSAERMTNTDIGTIIDNKNELDIVKFVENTLRIKLLDYQKEMLLKNKCLPRNAKLVIGRNGYIYVVEAIDNEGCTKHESRD